jgi:hypothetical protein
MDSPSDAGPDTENDSVSDAGPSCDAIGITCCSRDGGGVTDAGRCTWEGMKCPQGMSQDYCGSPDGGDSSGGG